MWETGGVGGMRGRSGAKPGGRRGEGGVKTSEEAIRVSAGERKKESKGNEE